MDERLATLERRVAELEKEVLELKANGRTQSNGTTTQYVRSQEKQPASAAVDLQALLHHMGIEGCKPIGAEQVQQQILAEGIRPEDNVFSRGIIDMREE